MLVDMHGVRHARGCCVIRLLWWPTQWCVGLRSRGILSQVEWAHRWHRALPYDAGMCCSSIVHGLIELITQCLAPSTNGNTSFPAAGLQLPNHSLGLRVAHALQACTPARARARAPAGVHALFRMVAMIIRRIP